jgi:hypothetical protein
MRLSLASGIGSCALCAAVWVGPAAAGAKVTSTWSAPDLDQHTLKKVAVLAKFTDDAARRILEDAVVAGLAKRGIEALPAYSALNAADFASHETIVAKADALGLDAGIVFSVASQGTEVKSGSNVHASVGVPVRAGPFSVFLGTSVPLGGGPTSVQVVDVKSELHLRASEGPRWIATFRTDLKAGKETAAEEIAAQALKQLKKAGVLD